MKETKRQANLLHLEDEIESGLLYQFLLSELFLAKKEVKRLLQCNLSLTHGLNESLKVLKKLAGAHRDSVCYWAWFPCEGIISRLRRYAISYASQQPYNLRNSQLICHLATHALTRSRECLEQCHYGLSNVASSYVFVQIKNLINNLAELFDELSHIILEEFEQFHADENVLFFLLRHNHEINELIEQNWIGKAFIQAFPEGITSVGEFLQKRYSQRQYEHLLPIITNYITTL